MVRSDRTIQQQPPLCYTRFDSMVRKIACGSHCGLWAPQWAAGSNSGQWARTVDSAHGCMRSHSGQRVARTLGGVWLAARTLGGMRLAQWAALSWRMRLNGLPCSRGARRILCRSHSGQHWPSATGASRPLLARLTPMNKKIRAAGNAQVGLLFRLSVGLVKLNLASCQVA